MPHFHCRVFCNVPHSYLFIVAQGDFTIFGLPGIGTVLSNAIRANDFMVIYGIVLFITVTIATLMVLVELVYPFLDPRISLEG
jgi:ABC-type dipeptide/oligopeptide/nickel transport system permease component